MLVPFSVRAQELKNGGYEDALDGKVLNWNSYRIYHCDMANVKFGLRAIRCESVDPKGGSGLMQEIVYETPDQFLVLFGGWSRAEQVIKF